MSDPRDQLITRLWCALVDAHGGADVERWAEQHYRDGITFTQIAEAEGVARSTVHKRVHRLRGALASYGLVPASWQRPRDRHVSKSANNASPTATMKG